METGDCAHSRIEGDANRGKGNCRGTALPGRGFLKRWFLANSLISGFLALCWLVLRSGPKPSRFAYPCQQAALSAATLGAQISFDT